MYLMLHLTARKYLAVRVPSVGGWHGSTIAGSPSGAAGALGIEIASLSQSDVLAEGSYPNCMKAITEHAHRTGRTITHSDWAEKITPTKK